jgi:hypothetical protein
MRTINNSPVSQEVTLKELSKRELLLVRTSIVILAAVLNICCIHLIF